MSKKPEVKLGVKSKQPQPLPDQCPIPPSYWKGQEGRTTEFLGLEKNVGMRVLGSSEQM